MKQPSYGTLISRALRLKCPRCGEAAMFSKMFRMHERCPACGYRFEREPGYFLGSIYINYGVTALSTTVTFVALHFGCDVPSRPLLWGLGIYCLVFPALFFRFARGLWVAMDCYWDKSIFDDLPQESGPAPEENPHGNR